MTIKQLIKLLESGTKNPNAEIIFSKSRNKRLTLCSYFDCQYCAPEIILRVQLKINIYIRKDNNMKVQHNENDNELFCTNCKSRINIGEKYITVDEDYLGDKFQNNYHPNCLPEMEE